MHAHQIQAFVAGGHSSVNGANVSHFNVSNGN